MELNQLSRIVFKDKHSYDSIDPIEKEKLFFIFNRMFARGVPLISDAINKKGIDKSLAMDVLFNYSKKTTAIPTWFVVNWSKIKTIKSDSLLKIYSDTDKYILSFYKDALDEERERVLSLKEDDIQIIKKKGRKKKA